MSPNYCWKNTVLGNGPYRNYKVYKNIQWFEKQRGGVIKRSKNCKAESNFISVVVT